jgi:hypothetical protein
LHAVYRYYGSDVTLDQVIDECPRLDEGGTLGVLLGCHALRRGFAATIFTYNLQVFDPTWFRPPLANLSAKLQEQTAAKDAPKLHTASKAYLEFLSGGGRIFMEDLTATLIRKHVKRQIPVLTGLSATYLYRDPREIGPDCDPDDVRGFPVGHFVVLCGYDAATRGVLVADPFLPNPLATGQHYVVGVDRVIGAILLGILTYDANLLIIEPLTKRRRNDRVHPDRGR